MPFFPSNATLIFVIPIPFNVGSVMLIVAYVLLVSNVMVANVSDQLSANETSVNSHPFFATK